MNDNGNEMTLDPPGRIAIIGAGPLGLEAALYGRFLGYDVTVLERGEVGQSLRDHVEEPLPMLPSVCLSPLAWSAISAQLGSGDTLPAARLPLTIGQWLAEGLEPLAKTDLLRGRVLTGHELTGIELVNVTPTDDDAEQVDAAAGDDAGGDKPESEDPTEDADAEVPADFRLIVRQLQSESAPYRCDIFGEGQEAVEFEAVILAIGCANPTTIAGIDRCQDSPYFFQLGPSAASAGDDAHRPADQTLRAGWREIVRIFAQLGGRGELDLYRPIRL